jgi:hypothetical protein
MYARLRRGAAVAALPVAAIAAFIASPALACSACGCTLTSDWIGQGLAATPGLRADLRYDFLPQTQLRSGQGRIDRGDITLPADREIEQSTHNHYITAGLDWTINPEWALNVQLPIIVRPHASIIDDDTDASRSLTSGLGDARITARWQGFGGTGITGIQLGLKLPTGGFHTRFDRGPQLGELLDRGLQAGTGTTDLILGAYHFGALATNFDWFAQVNAQIPLNRRDDYIQGIAGTGSIGIHYTGWRGIQPQLQFNLRLAAKDRGFNSDGDNSGGELFYASPGATIPITPRIRIFSFVQVPIYQRVVGYQLVPRITLSAGLQVQL